MCLEYYWAMNLLRRVFDQFKETIFGKDQLTLFLEKISPNSFLETVPESTHYESNIRAIFEYSHPLIEKAIWEIKYRRNIKIAKTW